MSQKGPFATWQVPGANPGRDNPSAETLGQKSPKDVALQMQETRGRTAVMGAGNESHKGLDLQGR